MVEERRWGYILNAPGMASAQLNIWQRLSILTSAYLLSFAIGCAAPIVFGLTGAVDPMRLMVAPFFAMTAVPFGWFATRGTQAYVYVNIYRGELREVVPNLVGKPTVLRRMPFDHIGGVRIDHQGTGDRSVLMLREGGEWRRIAFLDGSRRQLSGLREKLAQDLFRQQLEEATKKPANDQIEPAFGRTGSVHFCRVA